MRLRTTLRSSSALWAAPVALALPLFYFTVGRGGLGTYYGYAPSVVSSTLIPVYPFAYALAAGVVAATSLVGVITWLMSGDRETVALGRNTAFLVDLMLLARAIVGQPAVMVPVASHPAYRRHGRLPRPHTARHRGGSCRRRRVHLTADGPRGRLRRPQRARFGRLRVFDEHRDLNR